MIEGVAKKPPLFELGNIIKFEGGFLAALNQHKN